MTNFLKASWENIIMANYQVPVSVLKPYLPKGTEIDLFENKAYVSLVGFLFRDTKIFNIPIPLLGTFAEVNLRFYVTRKEGSALKRGVEFINETVPYKAVAWLANKLYKEHYSVATVNYTWDINDTTKKIMYQWEQHKNQNQIYIEAENKEHLMPTNSFEEFIFEHYVGYTQVNATSTEEYDIYHPRWKINKILKYTIACDFDKNYGADFAFLNLTTPTSVFMAEGSDIEVKWKRKKI